LGEGWGEGRRVSGKAIRKNQNEEVVFFSTHLWYFRATYYSNAQKNQFFCEDLMPFSLLLELQYKDLVDERIKQVTFTVPADFDVFCAVARERLASPTHLPERPYEEELRDLQELMTEGFDLYATENVVDLVNRVHDNFDGTSYNDVPAFIPAEGNAATLTREVKIQEAKTEFKKLIINRLEEKLAEFAAFTVVQRTSYIEEQRQRRAAATETRRLAAQPYRETVLSEEESLRLEEQRFIAELNAVIQEGNEWGEEVDEEALQSEEEFVESTDDEAEEIEENESREEVLTQPSLAANPGFFSSYRPIQSIPHPSEEPLHGDLNLDANLVLRAARAEGLIPSPYDQLLTNAQLNVLLQPNGLLALREGLIDFEYLTGSHYLNSHFLTVLLTSNGLTALRENLLTFAQLETLIPAQLELLLTDRGLAALRENSVLVEEITHLTVESLVEALAQLEQVRLRRSPSL
jgi:hypothetical protein